MNSTKDCADNNMHDANNNKRKTNYLHYESKTSKHSKVLKKWLLVFMAILILGIAVYVVYRFFSNRSPTESKEKEMISDITGIPTIPGEDVLYPTVMVDGKLYEWRRGSAIVNTFTKDDTYFLTSSDYYGKIKKTEMKNPEADCELSCMFAVEGKIYTVQNEEYIYLVMTTDWLDNAIVIFDEKE